MRTPGIVGAALLAVTLTAGCSTNQAGPKQTVGTIIGGAAGGLAGAQFGSGRGQLAATALGAIAGAYVGSEVGASLDKADKKAMQRTTTKALENNRTGTTSTWKNPDSGHRGSVTPTETYQAKSGQYCREFTTAVVVDGKRETAKGTACREDDGTWRIVQ